MCINPVEQHTEYSSSGIAPEGQNNVGRIILTDNINKKAYRIVRFTEL